MSKERKHTKLILEVELAVGSTVILNSSNSGFVINDFSHFFPISFATVYARRILACVIIRLPLGATMTVDGQLELFPEFVLGFYFRIVLWAWKCSLENELDNTKPPFSTFVVSCVQKLNASAAYKRYTHTHIHTLHTNACKAYKPTIVDYVYLLHTNAACTCGIHTFSLP